MNSEYEFTGIGSAGDGSGADPDHLGSLPIESIGSDSDNIDANEMTASEADNVVRRECRGCASHQGGTNFEMDNEGIRAEAPGQTEAADLCDGEWFDTIPGSYTCNEDYPRRWNAEDNTGNDSQDDDRYPRVSY